MEEALWKRKDRKRLGSPVPDCHGHVGVHPVAVVPEKAEPNQVDYADSPPNHGSCYKGANGMRASGPEYLVNTFTKNIV